MPISHFFAEGIGPFRKVHLDLRGQDGRPDLGPHILAGVNGSGKSTILKAITWCLAGRRDGFPAEEWVHFLKGYPNSRALLILDLAGEYQVVARTNDRDEGWLARLTEWVLEEITAVGLNAAELSARSPLDFEFVPEAPSTQPRPDLRFPALLFSGGTRRPVFNAAAYSSARFVHFIERPDMSPTFEKVNNHRFAFQTTVQNAAIQSWLLSLYSKRAIAKERRESSIRYTESFDALERGLRCVYGNDLSIVVDIEPNFQPGLRLGNKVLNFSQIPDGLKATLGWMADFMMRSESQTWDPKLGNRRPGLLLFDEIEGFLHPLWQRRLLPAMREALPETQAIVTSHSPFVISSSAHSVIHVLKLNKDGSAYAEPPVKAPIGESITSTLKDIFGVDSRFDVETEKLLNDWNELSKIRAEHKLKPTDESRFKYLTRVLSSRSEELRSIVNPIAKLPKATVDHLTEPHTARPAGRRRIASR